MPGSKISRAWDFWWLGKTRTDTHTRFMFYKYRFVSLKSTIEREVTANMLNFDGNHKTIFSPTNRIACASLGNDSAPSIVAVHVYTLGLAVGVGGTL